MAGADLNETVRLRIFGENAVFPPVFTNTSTNAAVAHNISLRVKTGEFCKCTQGMFPLSGALSFHFLLFAFDIFCCLNSSEAYSEWSPAPWYLFVRFSPVCISSIVFISHSFVCISFQETDSAERSSDVSNIITEVIGKNNWVYGNPMVFLIHRSPDDTASE
jgi:hypothetical protein